MTGDVVVEVAAGVVLEEIPAVIAIDVVPVLVVVLVTVDVPVDVGGVVRVVAFSYILITEGVKESGSDEKEVDGD